MPHPEPIRRSLRARVASSELHVFAFAIEPTASGATVDAANPKWIQVCKTGTYKGYRGGGKTFTITDETFAQMEANFRAHPSYVAGTEQLAPEDAAAKASAGVIGVVPFDIDHVGGPSEAWALEVARRPDGKGGVGLWYYTYFLEPAYTWMCESRFKWTSITWESDATDPVSGAKIGAYVMSVALTNDPFVQGMSPIQQGRAAPLILSQSWDPWSPPRTASELLCALRRLFGLPEIASLELVLGSVSALRAWASGELEAPAGVEVAELVGQLRLLLNLPTLSDAASIFVELNKLLGAVATEQKEETPMPDPAAKPLVDPIQAARPHIVTHFATKLAVAAEEPTVTLELERRLGRGDDALALVDSLMKALGAKTGPELAGKITELVDLKARMDELIPQMASMEEGMEGEANGSAEQDVSAVMASRQLPEAIRGALLLQRKGGSADFFKSLPMKERVAKREAARTEFLKQYEVAALEVPEQYRHLYGRTLFAGPDAVFSARSAQGAAAREAHGTHLQQPAQGQQAGAPAQFARGQGGPSWDEVNTYEGNNDAERVCAFVRAQDPKLTYDAAWVRANKVRADLINREGPSPV